MSVFTMIAIIVVTSIVAKSIVKIRTGDSGDTAQEIKKLRAENSALKRRVHELEEEVHLLEDLDGDQELAAEIERVARETEVSAKGRSW